MRILVTGGAGYVGCVTVEGLLAAGHDVTVLDTLVTSRADRLPPGAVLAEGSCGDRALVTALLRERRIDAVIHCAARSLVGQSMTDPALYYHENVVGGIALLDACIDAGVTRFVFSSTAAVYGIPARTPIAEADPTVPVNPYGETMLEIGRAHV